MVSEVSCEWQALYTVNVRVDACVFVHNHLGWFWLYTWQVARKLCCRMHHTVPFPVTCCGSLGCARLQKEFCEEFDAVVTATAGKPVMLTGE